MSLLNGEENEGATKPNESMTKEELLQEVEKLNGKETLGNSNEPTYKVLKNLANGSGCGCNILHSPASMTFEVGDTMTFEYTGNSKGLKGTFYNGAESFDVALPERTPDLVVQIPALTVGAVPTLVKFVLKNVEDEAVSNSIRVFVKASA